MRNFRKIGFGLELQGACPRESWKFDWTDYSPVKTTGRGVRIGLELDIKNCDMHPFKHYPSVGLLPCRVPLANLLHGYGPSLFNWRGTRYF